MKLKRINLHNHTHFSDGRTTPKELIENAISSKLDAVAITDHYEYFLGFFKFKSNINLYLKVLEHLKKKYSKKIKILTGLEIDLKLCDEIDLPYELSEKIDILLFERVYTFDDLNKLIKIRKNFPNKIGLAHPKLDAFTDLKKLANLLEKNKIFLELNTSCYIYKHDKEKYDLSKLPLIFEEQEDFFKLLKNRKVEISVSTDNHWKEDDINDLNRAYSFLKKMNLEKNFIKI